MPNPGDIHHEPGEVLRRIRTDSGLTQTQLSYLYGYRYGTPLNRRTIGHYENGERSIDVQTYARLLNTLGARLIIQAPPPED